MVFPAALAYGPGLQGIFIFDVFFLAILFMLDGCMWMSRVSRPPRAFLGAPLGELAR